MREGAKKRLVGSVAIVALAAIFVPMLFEEKSLAPPPVVNTPPIEPDFNTGLADTPVTDALPETNNPIAEDQYTESPVETDAPTRALPTAADDFGIDPGAAVPELTIAPPVKSRRTTAPALRSDVAPPPNPVTRAVTKPKPSAPLKPPKEIAAPAPKKPEAKTTWVIQVASLGNAETAANLQQKLRKAGFAAFVEKAEVRGKQYYRVRVGPNTSRASAERAAAKLRQQQKLETLIQRTP